MGGTHHRPGTGWMKSEMKHLILAEEGRYGDLKCIAWVGWFWHIWLDTGEDDLIKKYIRTPWFLLLGWHLMGTTCSCSQMDDQAWLVRLLPICDAKCVFYYSVFWRFYALLCLFLVHIMLKKRSVVEYMHQMLKLSRFKHEERCSSNFFTYTPNLDSDIMLQWHTGLM